MKIRIVAFFCLLVGCFLSTNLSYSGTSTKIEGSVERGSEDVVNDAIKAEGDVFAEVLALFEQKKYDLVIEKLLPLQEGLDMPMYNFYLGLAYYNKKQPVKALEYFDHTLELYFYGTCGLSPMILETIYTHKMDIAIELEYYKEALKNCNLAISYSDGEAKQGLENIRIFIFIVVAGEKVKA